MDAATQAEIADRIHALHATAAGTDLAPAPHHQAIGDYTTREVLARELERLFLSGAPLAAGLSGAVRNPGDWFTFDACGRSAIVCRGRDGRLRAFANACRHRGMRLVSGTGRGKSSFACPYHSWTYDLEGRLKIRPGEEGFTGTEPAELGLLALPVREQAGVVFVGLAAAEWSEASLLAGAEREIGPFGLDRYHWFAQREHRAAMNWKLGVDSFMEAYHLHSLHKNTLRKFFFDNVSVFDAFGRHCRILGLRRSFEKHQPGESLLPHVTLLYQLAPNAVLIYQQDHVQFYEALPDLDDPGRCTMRITLYAPEEPADDAARRHWDANMDLIFGVTTSEDFAACERIHANLKSGALPYVIFGRNEPALIHVHRSLNEAIA